jgi:hypothetical protein
MASNVISRPISVIAELKAIIKIPKCRRLHEGQNFVPMTMEVYGVTMCDMDRFIRECVHLFHDR